MPQAALLETKQVLVRLEEKGGSGGAGHPAFFQRAKSAQIEVRNLEGELLFMAAQFQRLDAELLEQSLDMFSPLSLRIVERGCSIRKRGCGQAKHLEVEAEPSDMKLIFREAFYIKNKGCSDRDFYDAQFSLVSDSEGLLLGFAALRNPQ